MSLSERARRYIASLNRDDRWTTGEEETLAYLASQRTASYQEFLRFQVTYSGYELSVTNAPGDTFSCQFFSKEQVRGKNELDLVQAGDRLMEICGIHKTAQFTFYLTDRGELCTMEDELPNVLHSTFDKFVEAYALRNEIAHWNCNPYYFEVSSPQDLKNFMGKEFEVVEECSDTLATWWRNDQIIAVKGVWLDRPEFYFHVYGAQRQSCDDLIEGLKRQNILKASTKP